MKKRIFSILLILCMVLTFMPTVAMATTPTELKQENVSDGTLTLTDGNSYKLMGDIKISKTISISGTVTLDLNGHVLKYSNNYSDSDSVIKISNNGSLTINDSKQTAKHTDSTLPNGGVITGGTGIDGNGGGIYVANGSVTMNAGTIYGCTAIVGGAKGGGIYVANGSVTISGGTISGCNAVYGGGIYVAGGSVEMSGGTISECTAEYVVGKGGGIYVAGGSVEMSGGTISECTAVTEGDGVYVYGDAESNPAFTLSGGTINNSIYTKGHSSFEFSKGSINSTSEFQGKLTVNPAVDNNVSFNPTNNGSISITNSESEIKGGTFHRKFVTYGIISNGTFKDEVTNGGRIRGGNFEADSYNSGTIENGTFEKTVTNLGTISGGTFNGAVKMVKYKDNYGTINGGIFFGEVLSDNPYDTAWTVSGGVFYGGGVYEGKIADGTKYFKVDFDLDYEGGKAPAAQFFVNTDTAKAKEPSTAPTRAGYKFDGWYEKDDQGKFKEQAFDFENTTISDNIMLYAKWKSKKKYTVNIDANGGNAQNSKVVNYDDKISTAIENATGKEGYEFTAWKCGSTDIDENTTYADLAGSDDVDSITLTAQWKDNQPPTFDGLKDGESYRGDVTFTVSDNVAVKSVSVQSDSEGTTETLTASADGKYTLKSGSGRVTVTATDEAGNANAITVTVNNRSSSSSVSQKPTISFGDTTDVKVETAADGSIVYTTAEGKLVLSKDGTSASITATDGYEVANVSVNGTDKGAVTTLTGLKTGDKIVVTFKQTAEAQTKAEIDQIKSMVEKLSLTARSTKTAKKNIKVTLKTGDETTAAIKEIKNLGYTVKYKYYRSTKKTSKYVAKVTKAGKTYVNTNGKNGTRYYYKVRVQIYDADGKMIAQTALKQCKYATRIWTK